MTMKCPACAVPLMMSSRQNVEIDYCPQCRGVWLDRGELDKIIERSAAEIAAPSASPTRPRPQDERPAHYGYSDSHKYKRKKSFLEELFD